MCYNTVSVLHQGLTTVTVNGRTAACGTLEALFGCTSDPGGVCSLLKELPQLESEDRPWES